jgi:predicted MFS family arabinose efflux permease
MTVSNVLLALSCVPLFLVDGKAEIWIIYLVVFVQCGLEQLFLPAEAAMVPRVVPPARLVTANALNAQNRQAARLIGAALGGVLVAVGGITLVAVVDLVSYAVAAALCAMVRTGPADSDAAPARRTRLGHEWSAGVRMVFADSGLTTLFVFRMLSGFGEGVVSVLLAPLIINVLQASSTEYGTVISAQAIGGIGGGLAVAVLGARIRPRLLLGYGALGFGGLHLTMALYPLALPVLWPVFVLVALMGPPLAAMNAGYTTLQQTNTPEAYRGRVFGVIGTGWAVAVTAGTVLASVLGDVVGIIAVISCQGLLHLFAGPYVLVRLRESPASTIGTGQQAPVVLAGEETAR